MSSSSSKSDDDDDDDACILYSNRLSPRMYMPRVAILQESESSETGETDSGGASDFEVGAGTGLGAGGGGGGG